MEITIKGTYFGSPIQITIEDGVSSAKQVCVALYKQLASNFDPSVWAASRTGCTDDCEKCLHKD